MMGKLENSRENEIVKTFIFDKSFEGIYCNTLWLCPDTYVTSDNYMNQLICFTSVMLYLHIIVLFLSNDMFVFLLPA